MRVDAKRADATAKRNAWRELRAAFPEREDEIRQLAARLGVTGVTVTHGQQVVAEWGDTDGHSV